MLGRILDPKMKKNRKKESKKARKKKNPTRSNF
jgi:hypothetical protein